MKVDSRAEFPGGQQALNKYLAETLVYPEPAIENDIRGRVFIRFTITRKGEVKNAAVIRSVDPYLDSEALRVVLNMPRWKPGKMNGKLVDTYFNIPITFKLE